MKACVFAFVAGVAGACISNGLAGQFEFLQDQPASKVPLVREVRHLAFSKDGKILFAANDRVVAWNLETKSCISVSPPLLRRMRVLSGGIVQPLGRIAHVLAFSPDGVTLAASHVVSEDGSIVPAAGEHAGVVGVVAFSPDGRLLMSSTGGETKLWDTRDGSLMHTITARNLGRRHWDARCACFSPDSKTLVLGGRWSKILLLDTATGAVNTRLAELDIASCHISALKFSPDGNTLVSGDSSGNVRLWNWK